MWDAPARLAALGESCPLGTQSFPEPGSVGAAALPVTHYPVPAALAECPGYTCMCVLGEGIGETEDKSPLILLTEQ